MIDAAFSWLVTFASPMHLVWCIISVTGAAVPLALGRHAARWHPYAILFHAVVAIEAFLHMVLLGPERDTAVLSVHCIWFNALMVLAHWTLLRRRIMRDRKDP